MSTTTDPTVTVIGVGLDTARYGHHVTFLNEKREFAAKPFDFLESRSGYQRLEKTLGLLANKHPNVQFQIRVDAAGRPVQRPVPKAVLGVHVGTLGQE